MEDKLTAEQIEKFKTCKTAEEAKALAEAENIELTDEQLEEVVGGFFIPKLPDLQQHKQTRPAEPSGLFQGL